MVDTINTDCLQPIKPHQCNVLNKCLFLRAGEAEEFKTTSVLRFLSLNKMKLGLNFMSPFMQEIRGLTSYCITLVFEALGSIWQTLLLKLVPK